MNKTYRVACSLILALLAPVTANADTVILHTPAEHQIMGLSPNGKWACGVFTDVSMENYAFRWNLESGTIEILSAEECIAWDVANDGTVSGVFSDKEALGTGAAVELPGYWRDGKWHHLEMPSPQPMAGTGGCITPDGHYMTGSLEYNGVYTPYIWKDGQIYRDLGTGQHAVTYAISPDGESAAGFNTTRNRTACYWGPNGQPQLFTDSGDYSYGPWNYARNFSPDGSKLLYWGGWELDEANNELYLYSIYDVATGERYKVQAPSIDSDLEFDDISNNGMLVGYNLSRGYVWADGQGMYIDDYLRMRNVDLSQFEDFYNFGDYYEGQLPISRIVAVSEDENALAMRYYNTDGRPCSMVLKMDQDLKNVPPTEVNVKQLSGLKTVELTWKRYYGATSVRGYNIYRDGRKLNGILPVNVPYYYDRNVDAGTHIYTVAAVSMEGIETQAEPLTVTVKDGVIEMPKSLVCRQKGIDNAYMVWEAPLSNIAHLRYFNVENPAITGFRVFMPIEMEAAIRYDKILLNNYKDYTISEVSFWPMSHCSDWAINLYTYDAEGQLELLTTQAIEGTILPNQLNTVKLDTPVNLPNGDLVVGISVNVENETPVFGTETDKVVAGRSDLIRMTYEDDFYSIYESALETMTLSRTSWAIDLGLQSPNAEPESLILSHYNVSLDGTVICTTEATNYEIENLSNGLHTVSIQAQYASGTVSDPIEKTLTIAKSRPAVEIVSVNADDANQSVIHAQWDAPMDNDLTHITYSKAKKTDVGFCGLSSYNYEILVANDYPNTMLCSYDGYRIKGFRYYPLSDAQFIFMLYQDGEMIFDIDVTDIKPGEWNFVALPEDMYIDGHSSYRLLLDCYDGEPEMPVIGIDTDMPLAYVSDLYSSDNGMTWSSISADTGTLGNWMIGMVIETEDMSTLNIAGYDVTIDGILCNDTPLADATYTHDFGETTKAEHTLRVDTWYEGIDSSIKGEAVNFILHITGMTDTELFEMHIRNDRSTLTAEGAESISLYDMKGKEIATSKTDTMVIGHLSAGIYVVKAYAEGKTYTQKISILR